MKVKVILAIIALIATVGTVGIASTQNTDQTKDAQSRKVCYVDANKNGVCDKYEKGACTLAKKGLCDGSGKVKGKGKVQISCEGNDGKCADFVDANNNGICDSKETVNK